MFSKRQIRFAILLISFPISIIFTGIWIGSNGNIISPNWSLILAPIVSIASFTLTLVTWLYPRLPLTKHAQSKDAPPREAKIEIPCPNINATLFWSRDSERVAIINPDGSGCIITGKTRKKISSFGKNTLLPGPSQKLKDGRIASISPDGTLQIVNPFTGHRTITTFPNYAGSLGTLSLAPNGKDIGLITTQGDVELRDTLTGEIVRSFHIEGGACAVAWAPNGDRIAAGSSFGNIDIWNVRTGRSLLRIAHSGALFSIVWGNDGKEIFSMGPHGIKVWDASTGAFRHEIDFPQSALPQIVTWSPNAKFLAIGTGKIAQILDVNTGQTVLTYRGHTGPIQCIDWSPDTCRVASASTDKTVQIWRAVFPSPTYRST